MAAKRVSISVRPPRDSRAEAWVHEHAEGRSSGERMKGELYTARLTIDVTPVMRGRIKVAAFQRGTTVAELVRALLEREFADERGEASS